MASPFHPSTAVNRPGAYHAPVAAPAAPPGTFAPGTKVQVGGHRVVIEKYLSEGGFAHVYVVRDPTKTDKTDVSVLKRVAVPDKDALANMRTEVETMKKLKGHRHIVTYIDSHASQLKGGGYEVFLLMEFCQGGGLIDFMNTRLQHRLTEPEILKIFSDVAEGVACMHYLKPPLLHRDLKVENVLISTSGSSRLYKLCDFGSSAPPRPAATTAAEGRLIEDDVQRHTTMQYRSPEMIDVYRKQPIDEKSDIWALGVLLYKLCYYTTPFEEQGQMAILNATYRFPPYPAFSDRTKAFIASMLRENPQQRPNIFQVVKEVCAMRNTPCPIKDIYSGRTHSEARHNQQLPSPEPTSSPPPAIGLQKAAPVKQVQAIPDITPMRRGRPTGPSQQPPAAKPSPSPMRGGSNDPFAALDSQSVDVRSQAADELAAKFPSLDEFSILHERGNKFQFAQNSPVETKQGPLIQQRVAQALADEAFAVPTSPPRIKREPAPVTTSGFPSRSTSLRKPQTLEQKPTLRETPPPQLHQPTPQRPAMVSTGIQTSSSPPPPKFPDISSRPIYRFPPAGTPSSHGRAPSQPRAFDNPRNSASTLSPETISKRPSYIDMARSKSSTTTLTLPQSPSSSRPSLEMSRPSTLDLSDPISRSKSANARARPSSVHVESSLDYLREREASRNRVSKVVQQDAYANELQKVRSAPSSEETQGSPLGASEKTIESNVDFLRSMEDDGNKKGGKGDSHRRTISGSSSSAAGGRNHSKRSSNHSLSLSTTKNILAGRFGDAFRRFEGNGSAPEPQRTPSPAYDSFSPNPIDRALTPIAGSQATSTTGGSIRSDANAYPAASAYAAEDALTPAPSNVQHTPNIDDYPDTAIDETQDLPPEVRRELERRRLSAEEKRVADAAAEYRRRVAAGGSGSGSGGARGVGAGGAGGGRVGGQTTGPGPGSRASTIQNRVRSLLDEGRDKAPVQRTAEGYGRFTREVKDAPRPVVGKKPVALPGTVTGSGAERERDAAEVQAYPRRPGQGQQALVTPAPLPVSASAPASSAPAQVRPPSSSARPSAPPKPRALRTGGAFEGPAGQQQQGKPGLAGRPVGREGEGEGEDWEASFSRRYPSLSGIEMVERDV